MRRGLALCGLVALSLAGCEEEPSFDDRYDAAKRTLEQKAAKIDRDLVKGLADTPQAISTEGEGEASAEALPET